MVDQNATLQYTYNQFSTGLNYRDDQNNLRVGETPFAQNWEAVQQTGLRKRRGWQAKFPNFLGGYNVEEAFDYRDSTDKQWYLTVAYPYISLISPDTGNKQHIATDYIWTGDPEGVQVNDGRFFLVDGVNLPRLINGTSVTTVSWPPSYSTQNNARLDQSNNAVESNPTGSQIGLPSLVAFHLNRVWLSGDKRNPKRIYASAISSLTDFGTNPANTFNIAFWVDVPCRSPITALKVINNQYLVIYCEREIYLMTGSFPPGTHFPQPWFDFNPLNLNIGCLGPKLVTHKGNNDHFFVGNNGVVYQLGLTDNFQQVKPLGLTSKIFPALRNLTNDTFKRGRLINFPRKGELQFWLPSSNQRRYPDQCYVLNYSDKPEEESWSLDKDFGSFYLRSAFIDSETSDLILCNPNNFLNTDTGFSFNEEAIKLIYQGATLDFGDPDIRKEIVNIDIYARSSTGASLIFYHLWDNGNSGYEQISIPANPDATFLDANWGNDSFTSSAGQSFTRISFHPANRIGKIYKFRLQNNSADEDLTINQIVFRYRLLGK